MRTSNALLKVAFGMSMNFVRCMEANQDKSRPTISLSRAIWGCQVDRGATFYKRWTGGCMAPLCLALMSLLSTATQAQVPADDLPPLAPVGLVWEAPLEPGSVYYAEVDHLLMVRGDDGHELKPRSRARVGLKVNTRSGRGLSTPLQLLRYD